MRRTFVGLCALVLTLTALLLPAGASSAAGSCTVGRSYLDVGFLDRALREFKARAKARCGRKGVNDVTAERIRRADVAARKLNELGLGEEAQDRLRNSIVKHPEAAVVADLRSFLKGSKPFAVPQALQAAGLSDAARRTLAIAIRTNPNADVPASLQTLPQAQAARNVEIAKALKDAGLDKAAQEEVKKAIAIDPSVTIPDRLKDVNRELSGWGDFKSEFAPRVRLVLEVLAVALLAFALLVVLWRAALRLGLRIDMPDFEAPGNETLSSGLPVALQDHVHEIAKGSGGLSLGRITPSGEYTKIDVPTAVTAAIPQAALGVALVTLLGRLIPGRVWKLTGAARELDPQRGAGLTLLLGIRGGKLLDEITIWQDTYGPVEETTAEGAKHASYYELALPAAVWAIYAAERHRALKFRRFHRFRFRILGTADWRSYAFFVMGAAWESWADPRDRDEAGVKEHARRLYWNALNEDDRNDGARFNLALSYLGDPAQWKGDPDGRIGESLGWINDIQEARQKHWRSDPLWYRASFQSAVARLRRAGELSGNDKRTELATALNDATQLASTLEKRLLKKRHLRPWKRGAVRDLRVFLASCEAAVLAHLATAYVKADAPEVGWKEIASRKELRQRLELGSMGVSRSRLVEYIESKTIPSAGGRINLACYYSRLGDRFSSNAMREKRYKKSLVQIRKALDIDPSFVKEAEDDPDLNGVRKSESTRKEFERIVKQHKPKLPDPAWTETPTGWVPKADFPPLGRGFQSRRPAQAVPPKNHR